MLGPLEVRRGGEVVPIGAAKQRALLAMLLLHANEVVSTDRLVDALWGEQPPARPDKALQVYVSQLRKLLAGAPAGPALVTRAPGYVLELPAEALDASRFERLTGDGRQALAQQEPARAADRLDEALALWRGPALADLAYEPFAQAAIGRLEEQRLMAEEDRIEAGLALGEHTRLSGRLEELVAEHPLRERLRGQLMLALYRAGRQADALAVFQDGRRALVDELGIEPGRELRALHQAILQQDSGLELPRAEQQTAPAARVRAPVDTARPPDHPSAPAGGRQARKTVTATFVGLTTWPTDGELLDPEAARTLVERALELVRVSVERHGGAVRTVAEESVTAVYGLPVVHEDDALRAVRSAVELRPALEQLAVEVAGQNVLLEQRIAISTGEVIAGGDSTSQLQATGVPLVVSARLAPTAAPGEIVLDEPTYRRVRDSVLAEQAEAPVRAYRLLGLSETGVRSLRATPMVGRTREQRRLQDAFDQAVSDRSCQLFTVLGHAGVGKSRLVSEFVAAVEAGALVAQGRCLPYGEGITYWPLLEAVKEAAGLSESDTPEHSREKLAAVVAAESDGPLTARRLAGLIGLDEADASAEEGFRAVQAFFEALGRRRPLVLVFDDIHWAQPTFLDLVEHVAAWTREAAVLLLCVARPELIDVRPGWGGGTLNATTVLLEPLSLEESAVLIESLAGTELDAGARQQIVTAAEGNPLFVEEMLALALEQNGNGALAMPPNIQALLAARLDRLSDDERAVLEPASVEGKVFHEGSVAELVPAPLNGTPAESLGSLVRKELIRPDRPLFAGEQAFRFRHLLIRDAAYESIPKSARSTLHEGYAQWLQVRTGARLGEYEEIIGYHLEAAHRYRTDVGGADDTTRDLARRAADRLAAAGRRALSRSDAPAGVNLISRAAALLPSDDPARVELVPNVRTAQGIGADLAWAESILAEALETGDERLRAHASVQRGFLKLFSLAATSPDELEAIGREAMAVLEPAGDDLGMARAWRLLAQARYLARHAEGVVDASEQALVHARRAGDEFETKEIVEWLAVALVEGPMPAAAASRRCQELLELTTGDRYLEVTLLAGRAYLEAAQGRREEGDALLARARSAAGDDRFLHRVAYYYFYAGLLLAAEPAAAERELREGAEALAEVGEQTNYCTLAAQLAAALYDQGRHEEALEFTRASERAANRNDIIAGALWRTVRARVLMAHGELEAAEGLAAEAVVLASSGDFVLTHARALVGQASVLAAAGKEADARAAADRAVELYESKGDIIGVARAQAVLQ